MQMRGQNPFVGGSSNGYYGSQNYYGNSQNGYPGTMESAYQTGHYGNYPEKSGWLL